MKNSDPDDAEWAKTRELLRKHLVPVPPLRNPDFINSRVMEAIERETREKAARPTLFSLRWLTATGLGALAAAALLMVVVLPRQYTPRNSEEFISQVVDARSGNPDLSVSSFKAPEDRGVVLWLDGVDYIPPEKTVR
ncbi:hypothetical protein BH09VER1_BH09VER1_38880 [soil metagenome]